MNYLDNNICKFTPLFEFTSNKKNIISCSFFKLQTTDYKNFDIYINGLINLYNYIVKNNVEYTLRLFIDESVYRDKSLFDKISLLKKIDVIIYHCQDYVSNEIYHYGLFGTLVRFFPFFDFDNNDADTVVIFDIDDSPKNLKNIFEYIETFNEYNKNNNEDIYFLKIGSINKNTIFNDFPMLVKGVPNPYCIAPRWVNFKRIDKDIIYHYFNLVNKTKVKLTLYDYKIKLNSNYITHDIFIYGIDEYFLNITLNNYLIDKNKTMTVIFKWSVAGILYWIFHDYDKYKKFNKYINNILMFVFDKLKLNNGNIVKKSVVEKFNYMDNLVMKKNRLSYKIIFYLYLFYIQNIDNPNYSFVFKKEYKYIISKFKIFGSYNVSIVVNSDYNKTNKFKFIVNDKFDKDELDKIKIYRHLFES